MKKKYPYKRGFARCKPCDKDLFRTRKEARKQARIAHPDKPLNAYWCPMGQGFHYGHLPEGGRDRAREILTERWNRHVRNWKTPVTDGSTVRRVASWEASGEDVTATTGEDGQVVLSNTLEGEEDQEADRGDQ